MDINTLSEYLKIHKISIEQDMEQALQGDEPGEGFHWESDDYYLGALDAYDYVLELISE
jgi:hypothetical protein